jgi:hypothetical protein
MTTCYRSDCPVLNPWWRQEILSPYPPRTDRGTIQPSLQWALGALSQEGERAKWWGHGVNQPHYLVPHLRMSTAIPLQPLCFFHGLLWGNPFITKTISQYLSSFSKVWSQVINVGSSAYMTHTPITGIFIPHLSQHI